MSKTKSTDVIEGILKIRKLTEYKTVKEIIKKESKNNVLFNKLLINSPEELNSKVEYLIKNSKNQREYEVSCRIVEVHFINTKNIEVLNSILKEIEVEIDNDSISILFYYIKRILIRNWGDLEVLTKILKCNFSGEKQKYLAVALAEALRVSGDSNCKWLESILEGRKEFKVYFLSFFMLDRNCKVYFDIKRYWFLYRISESECKMLLEQLKDRVNKETLKEIVEYLSESVSLNVLWVYLEQDTVINRIDEVEPERITEILAQYSIKDEIISKLKYEKLLKVFYVYMKKEYLLPQEKRVVAKILERVINEVHEIYKVLPTEVLLALLSEEKLEVLESILREELKDTVRRFLSEALNRYARDKCVDESKSEYKEKSEKEKSKSVNLSVNKSVSGSISENNNENEQHRSITATDEYRSVSATDEYRSISITATNDEQSISISDNEQHRSISISISDNEQSISITATNDEDKNNNESVTKNLSSNYREDNDDYLLKYVKEYSTSEYRSDKVLNRAICTGIRILNVKYNDNTLMNILEMSESKEIVRLVIYLLRNNEDSAVLNRCYEHSLVRSRSINVKEHLISIEEILKIEGNARDLLITSTYLSNILNTLPVLAQKIVLSNRKIANCFWNIIMKEYKKYEHAVLSGLTNSSTLSQVLSCSKSEYKKLDVCGVEGETVLFFIMHILNTKYPLQYIQVIDKMGIFHEPAHNEAESKWKYNAQNKVFKYKYNDIESVIEYALPESIKIDNNEYLKVHTVYEIVQEYILTLLSKSTLREYAVHALIGDFIEGNPDLRMKLELLHDKPRKVQVIMNYYTKSDIKIQVKPSTAPVKRKETVQPSKKERKMVTLASPETEAILEKEELRKTGILAAQLSVSKCANSTVEPENSLQLRVKTALEPYTQEQLNTAGTYFFKELERYWKTDRDKISSHFDSVIKIVKLFSKADGIERLAHILSGYLSGTCTVSTDGFDVLKEIVAVILDKNSTEKAFNTLNNTFKTSKIVDVYAEVLKNSSSLVLQDIFSTENPNNYLHQGAIKAVRTKRGEPVYNSAVCAALTQLSSRNDQVLHGALQLLKEEYTENPNSENSQEILKHAVRLLKIRTKIDSTGIEALEILKIALFQNNYQLDRNSKGDIIASIKYDLYHYKDILLFYIDELPIGEFLEIISNINSPGSKSVRNVLKRVIIEYTPPEREGPNVFTRLIEQARDGTAADKIFIIDLLMETLETYAQGNWTTLFLKTAELIGNESKPEVLPYFLDLLKKVVIKSQSKNKLKSIYKEWKNNKKLEDLVRKVSTVFK